MLPKPRLAPSVPPLCPPGPRRRSARGPDPAFLCPPPQGCSSGQGDEPFPRLSTPRPPAPLSPSAAEISRGRPSRVGRDRFLCPRHPPFPAPHERPSCQCPGPRAEEGERDSATPTRPPTRTITGCSTPRWRDSAPSGLSECTESV